MGDRPNVAFNIGSQTGSVTNVAGDLTVHGGIHSTTHGGGTAELREALAAVREAVARLAPPEAQAEAMAEVDAADQELAKEEPDRSAVAAGMDRLTGILTRFGALAGAGAALAEPVGRLLRLL